jgi:uncharacterized protein
MSSQDVEYQAYSAAINNNVERLRGLISRHGKTVVNIKPYERSLLLHAVLHDAYDAAQFLLDSGLDVNESDPTGYTALHGAAEKGDGEMARLLLHRGANPNMKDHKGNTPLSKSVYDSGQDIALIRALIAAGADPEFEFYPGMDAIRMARKLNKQWIVDYFDSLKKD